MSDAPARPIVPVILSGGSGTRLWPLSRRARPKQMLDLLGGGSMLGVTAARVTDDALFAPPMVVAAAAQAEAIEAALPHAGSLILEPEARNTAPAIALAALAADADDVLLVLPSDHMVGDPAAFRDAARRALPFALEGWIVTFGMKAERGETGYGYIERGPALGEGVHQAVRFVEKPDAATARHYLDEGCYDWNGGIFLFRADAYLAALANNAPEIAVAVRKSMDAAGKRGKRLHPEPKSFAQSPSNSIDYAIMEKSQSVAVVPIDTGLGENHTNRRSRRTRGRRRRF